MTARDTLGPRRSTYEHFIGYAHPWFSVCVRLDAAPLKRAVDARGGGFALACHWAALKAMQPIEAFRLRATAGGGVRVVAQLHAGTTVLKADDSFGFASLAWFERQAEFARNGRAQFDAARRGEPPAALDEASLVHCTTLPWLHFTSFTHARSHDEGPCNPKLAFGRLRADGAALWLPLSIDVHHALVDGLHVGRFVEALEALLAAPEGWVGQ